MLNKRWLKNEKDNLWIADSGASTHMTYVKDGFIQLKEENHVMCFGINNNESAAIQVECGKGGSIQWMKTTEI